MLADMWEAEVMTEWLNCVVEDYLMDCLYIRRIHPTPSLAYLRPYTAENAGNIDGDGIPGNASAIISFKTDVWTKSGRGRVYICGIDEADQSAGILDADILAKLNTLADVFKADSLAVPGGGTCRFAVWSRKDVAAAAIIVADPSPSIASMRSRRAPFGMIP
jgi:hypothetical protein